MNAYGAFADTLCKTPQAIDLMGGARYEHGTAFSTRHIAINYGTIRRLWPNKTALPVNNF